MVIGFIFGILQQYYFTYESQIQYLDYKIEQNIGFLSKPSFPDHDVKIMVDDNVTETLSKLTIAIFNYSDKDYSNVPIYISIITKDGKKPLVVGEYAVGENGIPETVKKISNLEPIHGKDVVRYGYTLYSVSRTEKLSPVFQANFLIEGKEALEIEVYTNYTGLKIRGFDYNHIPYFKSLKRKQFIITIGIIAIFILIYLIVIIVIGWLINLLPRKKKIKQVRELTDSISQNSFISKLSEEQRRDLIADILYWQDKNKWGRKSKLSRWLSGEKEPDRSQYTESQK